MLVHKWKKQERKREEVLKESVKKDERKQKYIKEASVLRERNGQLLRNRLHRNREKEFIGFSLKVSRRDREEKLH